MFSLFESNDVLYKILGENVEKRAENENCVGGECINVHKEMKQTKCFD